MQVIGHPFLFDFDGVLADSEGIHLDAWKYAFEACFKRSCENNILSRQKGRSTEAIARNLCQYAEKPYERGTLIQAKLESLIALSADVPLYPGALELLNCLRTNKIPFGIVSNSPRKFLEACVSQKSIPCDFFLGLENYRNPKPHPEPYLLGAEKLQLANPEQKSNIVVCEDSPHGIRSAKSAGMMCIGVKTIQQEDILMKAGADFTVNTVEDLLPLV
ncbi:MAG: HAD family hydrolase [Pseudobacteriovorax sp.]|nr:HAD family hydrolase [Pseudobacteriovorax sp.]